MSRYCRISYKSSRNTKHTGAQRHSNLPYTLDAQRQRKRVSGKTPETLDFTGAGEGGRTPTGVTPADFESAASAIPPLRRDETRIFYNMTAIAAIAEMAAMFERRLELC